MALRIISLVATLLLVLSMVWVKRSSVSAWLEPPPPPSKPIKFDNGSVRDARTASGAMGTGAAAPVPPGTMRKCVGGTQTTYTNMACPNGFKEQPVAGPPVNVLPAQSMARRHDAETANPAGREPAGPAGRSREAEIKARMMERAIHGSP